MPGAKGRRFQASIETQLPCELVGPGTTWRGQLVSFALGEVAVASSAVGAVAGDPVRLRVELSGHRLELDGIVARVVSAAGGLVQCGVRLSDKEETDRAAEHELLEQLLAAPATGRRQAPRVARRMPVTCEADEQFEADLVDISRAGLALEGRLPIKEGDLLTVQLDPRGAPQAPRLTGKVVYVSRLCDTESRAGVRFEGLDEQERRALAEYLRLLMRHR